MDEDLGFCDECAFWEEGSMERGECRVSSPKAFWNGFMERYEGVWPLTKNDDWCGKFRQSELAKAVAAKELGTADNSPAQQ